MAIVGSAIILSKRYTVSMRQKPLPIRPQQGDLVYVDRCRGPRMHHQLQLAKVWKLPGFEASGWYGLVAPIKTPPSIVGMLTTEINAGNTGANQITFNK